jgi:hypothetical protein
MLYSTAAFLALGLVPFVGEEMFQRRQQERAELPAFGAESFEIILLQEFLEESLHQILRVLFRLVLPSDIGVERIPVSLAKLAQRAVGLRRRLAPRGKDDRPARGNEVVAARRTGGWRGAAVSQAGSVAFGLEGQ